MLGDYASYNSKLTPRMSAIRLFYDMHGDKLSPQAKERLYQKKFSVKSVGLRGDILGIMTTKNWLCESTEGAFYVEQFFSMAYANDYMDFSLVGEKNMKHSWGSYKICNTCIMDSSDPSISFDEHGVCEYCNNFHGRIKPSWNTGSLGEAELMKNIGKKSRRTAKVVILIASSV
nr:hypothetical protein GCM10020185_08770 [Pseudomonas brassicacearum subsp. brassicacearum]